MEKYTIEEIALSTNCLPNDSPGILHDYNLKISELISKRLKIEASGKDYNVPLSCDRGTL
jgi:hypothetical protein